MIFLYIAAAFCVALCAANAALGVYALRRFRKWRGSVMARFAELDAMIAAVPSVLEEDREERDEKDKHSGVDITDEVMNLWRYSVADAFKALHKDGGDAE